MVNPVAVAIDGLVATWRDAPELLFTVDGKQDTVSVNDGPLLADPEAWRVLVVGSTAGFSPGAQSGSTRGFGGREQVQLQVACDLTVWDGATDLPTVRTQAYGVLDTLGLLLGANRDLGGTVTWARITQHTYQPVQSDLGVGVGIAFTVQVDATRFEGA